MELNKRSIRVEILQYNKDGETVFSKVFTDNISVKFYFEKFVGNAFFGRGKVSIGGLDKTTVEKLTTICGEEQAKQERKQIKIEAGYEGKKQALIIDGTIISAVPTVPPDVWVECELINGIERNKKMKSISLKGEFDIKELAEAIALQLNLKNGVDCRIKNDSYGKRFYQRKSKNVSFIGNAQRAVGLITQSYSFEKGDVFGVPKAYIDNETLVVDYSNFGRVESKQRTHHKINKDNGMVGLPEISNAGTIANITTILNPEIMAGEIIDLESYMIPKANGQYNVIGITYTGDYRGNTWYSMFHCRRITE